MGSSNIYYNNLMFLNNNADFRFNYLLNQTLINLENLDNVLFVGTNPRLEVPLLNSRLRKNYINNFDFKAFSIGLGVNHLTFPVIHLGISIKKIILFLEGKVFNKSLYFNDFISLSFFNKNKNIKNLNIFFGVSFLNTINSSNLYLCFFNITKNLNVINRFSGRINLNELGLSISFNKFNFFNSFNYFCNNDLDSFNFNCLTKNKSFNIYQGLFFHKSLLDFFNLILPVLTYFETVTCYLNLEGRFRNSSKIISSKTECFDE